MTDLDALRIKWPTVSPDIKRIMMERLKCHQHQESISKTGCANVSVTPNTNTGYK